jgi:hypothetical protein
VLSVLSRSESICIHPYIHTHTHSHTFTHIHTHTFTRMPTICVCVPNSSCLLRFLTQAHSHNDIHTPFHILFFQSHLLLHTEECETLRLLVRSGYKPSIQFAEVSQFNEWKALVQECIECDTRKRKTKEEFTARQGLT